MRPIPVTILGGSDRDPSELPERGLHPLGAYKSVAVEVGGRPLIDHLVERVNGAFGLGPLTIAGPERIYAPRRLAARILDTDGTLGENLRATIEHHLATHEGPLAVLASDVLPTTAELSELREDFERDRPCALWLPFLRVPEDPEALGAFGWKPRYRLIPVGESTPVPILPGHLCILDPRHMRLPLLYRLLELTYATRNRSVAHRRAVMLRRLLSSLLSSDLEGLFRLRAPTLTARVAGSGLRLARRLRAGALGIAELEHLTGRIFLLDLDPLHPERGIRLPIVDAISLAKDIDTEEEAREISRRQAH